MERKYQNKCSKNGVITEKHFISFASWLLRLNDLILTNSKLVRKKSKLVRKKITFFGHSNNFGLKSRDSRTFLLKKKKKKKKKAGRSESA